ncbi:alpha/beta fold hydrolase [Fulvivirga sp. M361]|uniref:alpha/beta fold hydrolase n=1 Tax=Fulvivirga sp. M361 TaxID=2594266 RepID=UPI00117B263C|nr:alpha/beta fold hydrolase [Fulvivirga sp. M361]TRX59176.1 alpha/beta fold hydrolase [Fulvivirga sp. M361]
MERNASISLKRSSDYRKSVLYQEEPPINTSYNRNLFITEPTEFNKPVTQYAKSGSIKIAYQVFGSGSIDLVYIPGWVSNIDWVWECPELVHFLRELGKITRVILFDKRGTGLSDRVVELSTLEERMDDIRAVMDAADSEKAVLFGHSEGGCVSALFAATYPNRVISLITFGIFAKRRHSPDYPWAPTDEERQEVYDMIEHNWGNGNMYLEKLAPSKSHDKKFMNWLANYFRSGASPSAAMVLTKMNTQVDIINVLSSIKAPTLVMQRTHDIDVKVEEGQFIAERIKGAEFVELDGRDHLFWVGDTEKVLGRMKAFISNEKPTVNHEEQLLTIVAVRIVFAHNTHPHPTPRELVTKVIEKYRGRLIQHDPFILMATFEGPSRAVCCSMGLMDVMQSVHAQLAIGIHITEVAVGEAYFATGETQKFVKLILDQARLNRILITQTVKHLLSGAGLTFTQENSTFETDSGDTLQLFTVTDPDHLNSNGHFSQHQEFPKDSFFEVVLQCIYTHLGNETFGVDTLCKSVGTSERQLQRKVKTITNKSPNQLISSVRLHRAKELLLMRKYSIAEVAFQIGFSSPSYFAKRFKKEFGISPSLLSLKN